MLFVISEFLSFSEKKNIFRFGAQSNRDQIPK